MSLYTAVCEKLAQRDFENENLCCLCFKPSNSGIRIDSEIQIDSNSGLLIKTWSSILESMVGKMFQELAFIFKTICKSCQEQAIRNYNFIHNIEENVKILHNVLENIDRCFKNMPDNLYNCNSLYLTIDPDILEKASLIKRCYDKQTHRDLKSVFERLKTINDSQNEADDILQNADADNASCHSDLQELKNFSMLQRSTEKKFVDIVIDDNSFPKYEDLKVYNYRCTHCYAGFNSVDLYNKHMNSKRDCKTRGRGLFKCKECDYKSPYKAQLQTHIRFKHKGEAFICEECGKACVSESSLKTHLESHTNDRKFDCRECGGKFKSAYTLKNHMTRHTGEKNYPCNQCEKKFNNASRRMEHIRRHHESNPVECDICHKVFKIKEDCRRHRKLHHTEKSARAKFPCTECSHQSYSKKQLQQHIAFKHRGERPFVCEVCGKKFGTEKMLALHNSSIHEKKGYNCTHCNQEFKSQFGLKSHMFVHTGEKPYQCQYCSETFKDSNRRLEHIKRQHIYDPQKCDLCEKVYRLKQDLYRHKKKHHTGVWLKKQSVEQILLNTVNKKSENENSNVAKVVVKKIE